MKQRITSKLIRLLLATCLVTLVACGDDNDGDTNVVVNEDGTQREEENGPVASEPTVIVNNNINNNVKVNNSTRIENNDVVMNWECEDAAPVIHRQYIHISVRCPTLADDTNGDGYVDEVETQQVVGPNVYSLDQQGGFPQGSRYTYSKRIQLSALWNFVPPGQEFVVMFYGADQTVTLPPTYQKVSRTSDHLTVPIACKVFRAPERTVSTTTGGRSGGGTVGGTTTGGTTIGGSTSGGVTTGSVTTGGDCHNGRNCYNRWSDNG